MDGPGDVFIENMEMGKTPLYLEMHEGSVKINVKWGDRYSHDWAGLVTLEAGSVTKVSATKTGFKFGERGPAGGIIFYDKGIMSAGWRYLEAAPSDQTDRNGILWNSSQYHSVDTRTDTAVGSGRANTKAIITVEGNGNYAAALCKKLTIGGFSDWFLPSKDELDLMYKNLKKAGFGSFGEGGFWSSSQKGFNTFNAWEQGFSDGRQGGSEKENKFSVRACRAF